MQVGASAQRFAVDIARRYTDDTTDGEALAMPIASIARVPVAETVPPPAVATSTKASSEPAPAPDKLLDVGLIEKVTERVYRQMCQEVREGRRRGDGLR